MKLPTTEELKQLSVSELIHLRFHKYKMTQRAHLVRVEIEKILIARMNEFNDDSLSYLIAVMPRGGMPNMVFHLYNSLIESLPDYHPHRYRFIENKYLSQKNRENEFLRWLKGKENARYFGRQWTHQIAMAIFNSSNAELDYLICIAELMLKKRTRVACVILTRPDLPNSLIRPAIKYVNSFPEVELPYFKLIIDKNLLLEMSTSVRKKFLTTSLIRQALPFSQFEIRYGELKSVLFSLTTSNPDFVQKVLQSYGERSIEKDNRNLGHRYHINNRQPRRLIDVEST